MLVHREKAVPCLAGHIGEAALVGHHSCICNRSIDTAHLPYGFGKCFNDTSFIRYIDFLRKNTRTKGFQICFGGGVGVLATPPYHDVAARFDYAARETKPDTRIAASNDNHLITHIPWQLRHFRSPRIVDVTLYLYSVNFNGM